MVAEEMKAVAGSNQCVPGHQILLRHTRPTDSHTHEQRAALAAQPARNWAGLVEISMVGLPEMMIMNYCRFETLVVTVGAGPKGRPQPNLIRTIPVIFFAGPKC